MRSERLTSRVPAVAAGVAIGVLIAGVAGFFAARQSLRDDDRRMFESRSRAIVERLERNMNEIVEAAASTGDVVGLTSAQPGIEVGDLSMVTAPLTALAGIERVDLAPPRLPAGAIADAAAQARDADEPTLTAATRDRREPVLVVPTYGASNPQDVRTRRELVTGYLLVQLDVDTLVSEAVRAPTASAIHLRVADGDVVMADFRADSDGEDDVFTDTFTIAGRAWEVQSEPASRFADGSLLPPGILLTGVLLAIGAAVNALAVRRVVGEVTARHRDRARELELIAQGGSLLHQSLDLADVLPAFSVKVADDLDLDRLGLLVLDDDGGLREVFALGGTSRWTSDSLPVNPASARAGEEFLVRLQRSGRNIGALRARSRAAVAPDRMRAIVALGDLLAAALGNIQLYAQEQESVRRLQEVDRLKNDFVGTVSHELRTTVTAIAGFADLLVQQWDSLPEETRKDFLRRVTRNAGSLRLLVDDMLDVTRIDRLALSVVPEPLDLSRTVTSVTEQMAAILEQHELIVDVKSRVRAWADARAVERILANLLSNAAKYSPAGGKVYVKLSRSNGRAVLHVDDEGPGVPPEERERIFARFYRGESEGARRTRGAGVGLAIVHELVERLGATVSVDAAPTGGARFTVSFPLEAPTTELVESAQGDAK